MEELKILVEMVSGLPNMALWVVVLFFVYKVAIIGSIYGVIRLAINRLHGWATTPKEKLIVRNERTRVDRLTITGQMDSLVSQLERLTGISTSRGSSYIHDSDIRWLSEAISEKIQREKEQ